MNVQLARDASKPKGKIVRYIFCDFSWRRNIDHQNILDLGEMKFPPKAPKKNFFKKPLWKKKKAFFLGGGGGVFEKKKKIKKNFGLRWWLADKSFREPLHC